ncbi:MAG TPA: tetratricopeptide repeat protein [Spirochaetota bacterium]|nr:tetratricopeptide repeat protein [Spirochaetota bacterium]HPJ37144.1 tetratricopeptide repeat protein [Spirochaetota bacterium]HPQ53284.1 tetratricopeptide repeat protein [Spirochaetota bacterium]
MERREIHIQRNIIENFLMAAKDFVKKNRKLVVYSLLSGIVVLILIISGLVYYDARESSEVERFESILDQYRNYSGDSAGKTSMFYVTVSELDKIVQASSWGYVAEYGNYVIGNLYFENGKYDKAKEYLLKHADDGSADPFVLLSLQKAAVACEYMNNHNDAFKIYKKMSEQYGDSIMADQIYYDLGRMYQKRNDIYKAREYYYKVITTYPRSIFSGRAKRRLFLLSYSEKNSK